MFIESVTIDGFKSYAKRVEINGFDQSFNAITGLNGTGKSNILDAICFVLGVKNLDKVRSLCTIAIVYASFCQLLTSKRAGSRKEPSGTGVQARPSRRH
jgi:recombinational DNA repair ATPase RecF